MIRDDQHPPARIQHRGTVAQQSRETFHLVIHRYAQSLEGARRRMRPAAPMGSQSALDDRAQLAGGLDWTAPARLDNQSRNSPRAALFPVCIDDAREFFGALLINNVFRLQRLPAVHPHVERAVEPK